MIAWVLALVYVRFGNTSLRMAASATGRGVAAMRLLTVSIFLVIVGVTAGNS